MKSAAVSCAYLRKHIMPQSLQNQIRGLFRVEASGIRTALAVVLPLAVGQLVGYAVVGLMAGLGGLYVAVAEKEGATWRYMLLATLSAALSAFAGTYLGQFGPLAVVSMFLIAFLGGMMAVYGILSGQIGFTVTLVFAVTLGIPAPLRTAGERLLEFGIGGLWGTLLTVVMWRLAQNRDELTQQNKREQNRVKSRLSLSFRQKRYRRWRKLRRNLTFRSEVLQHAARLAFISALAVALYKFLRLEHGAWLTLTVLVIVKPDYSSTRIRAGERVFGTLAGGILALLLSAVIHTVVITDILLLCLSVLAFSHQPRNYGLYAVFLTPFVVLLLNIVAPGDTELALVRVGDTLLGGALALAMAYLLTIPFAGNSDERLAAGKRQ